VMAETDPFAQAQVSAFSTKEKLGRALWMLVGVPLMRLTFHDWYGLRAAILRAFGAKVGRSCKIRRTAHVEIPWLLSMDDFATLGHASIVYNLGPITLGKRVTISQYAHLCAGTHDFTQPDMPLIRPAIVVKDDAWIATDAFVGPGVTVGEGALLGARASAFKDLEPWGIYAGNPARRIKDRPRYRDDRGEPVVPADAGSLDAAGEGGVSA